MGGSGSGNWYRFDKKDVVEHCQSIDVRRWKRRGCLDPGSLFPCAWYEGGERVSSIGVRTLRGRVELSYARGPADNRERVCYTVPLSWTACNFGGKRPWFVCPGVVNGRYCGRRVAKLYMRGRYFLCRHCHDLSYQSRQDNKMYRTLHRAQEIREGLGGSTNMMDPFPERPKGMHRSTYKRLFLKHRRAEMEHLARLKEWLNKLQ